MVVSEADGEQFLSSLNQNSADVLLIDLRDDEDVDLDFLDTLSEQSEIPILFNDSGPEGVSLSASGDNWAKKLAEKLAAMANSAKVPEKPGSGADNTPFPMVQSNSKTADESAPAIPTMMPATGTPAQPTGALNKADESTAPAVAEKINLWVLGASLGGPQAVRQFLASIQDDLPVAFILAQHIGANHVSLLAEQLNRVTAFTVLPTAIRRWVCMR